MQSRCFEEFHFAVRGKGGAECVCGGGGSGTRIKEHLFDTSGLLCYLK